MSSFIRKRVYLRLGAFLDSDPFSPRNLIVSGCFSETTPCVTIIPSSFEGGSDA
jgi:hypothetical protein